MLAVFVYTTVVNIIERPEGLKIAALFIVAIVGASLVSRVLRSTELRVAWGRVRRHGRQFLKRAAGDAVRIIANRPDPGDAAEYQHKLRKRAIASSAARRARPVPRGSPG